jgi:hypothetical protein
LRDTTYKINFCNLVNGVTRHSSVSEVTGNGSGDRGSIPDRVRCFSLLRRIQTGCGDTEPPLQQVPEVRRPEREAEHSTPSSAEVLYILCLIYFHVSIEQVDLAVTLSTCVQ